MNLGDYVANHKTFLSSFMMAKKIATTYFCFDTFRHCFVIFTFRVIKCVIKCLAF